MVESKKPNQSVKNEIFFPESLKISHRFQTLILLRVGLQYRQKQKKSLFSNPYFLPHCRILQNYWDHSLTLTVE